MVTNERNSARQTRWRGVTLTELLVSIGITVAMLLMTSVVFKSSTDASGRAMARGEIMHQLRAITRQLDQDFKGLRSDMPLAIIFEEDAGEPVLVRQDRIWFFANGDFQTNDYNSTASVSGNVAHIFYGQSLDHFAAPNEDALRLYDRRILTRREKILTADTTLNWFNNSYPPLPLNSNNDELKYDFMPVDILAPFNGVLNYWKNQVFANYDNVLFRDDSTETYSVIRRPNMVRDLSFVNGLKFFGEGEEGFQRLYVANDVTDFKVEVWFEGATEWFPNVTDLDLIVGDNLDLPPLSDGFAFYWNADEYPSLSGPRFERDIAGLEWRGETGLGEFVNPLGSSLSWTNIWPEALRFTFTLYDKNRRHFPEGETFSYIVKLAGR